MWIIIVDRVVQVGETLRMADITFDRVLALVDQLTPQEQTRLTSHLLNLARSRQLSAEEKMSLLRAVQVNAQVVEEPSVRRIDWYDDDGR
jgi:hypothetical protein